jgi:Nucleoside-diphosphate-sugar epimerases
LIAENEYELLVHHAAQTDVRRSVADPKSDADANIRGLLNLMEAGVENGLQRVIFASTVGAIYGEPEYTPQDLDHPLRPVSPYGVAKLSAEKYLYYYQQQYDVDTVVLRYANVYGPRQNPHGEAGVVAIFARQLLTGEQPVIYGDGKQTRDYVYVDDVVQANLAALSHQGNGIFNVGTERETSVNELFETMRASADVDASEEHAPAKPGEQQRSVLGVAQSEKTLGWEPQISLEQGLRRTVDWFRDNFS